MYNFEDEYVDLKLRQRKAKQLEGTHFLRDMRKNTRNAG